MSTVHQIDCSNFMASILLKSACCQFFFFFMFLYFLVINFILFSFFRLLVSREMITSPISPRLLLFNSEHAPPYVPTTENNTIKQELQNMAPS